MNTSHINPTLNTTDVPHTCSADTPLNELPRRLGLQSFAVVLEPLPHPAVFAQLRAALRLGRTRASLIADSLPIAHSCTTLFVHAPSHASASRPARTPSAQHSPSPAAHTIPSPSSFGSRPITARAAKPRASRDPQRQFRFPTKAA